MQVANITLINANLGGDPEIKQTHSGLDVLSFSCAVNSKRGQEESTAWYRVSVFGKQAQTLAGLLGKGSTVCVTGRLQPREFEGRAGDTRTSLDVTASDVILTGARPDRADEGSMDSVPF